MDSFDTLISEIKENYWHRRKTGEDRQKAVMSILNEHSTEMNDIEDAAAIVIGIIYGLEKKRELYPDIEILSTKVFSFNHGNPTLLKHIKKSNALLLDKSLYGKEASFARKRNYSPGWKIGDTFAYQISNFSETEFTAYWLLFIKIGQYTDHLQNNVQLFLSAISFEPTLPKTTTDIEQLGFVRTMQRDSGWNYTLQARITSKRTEHSLRWTFIGTFPDIRLPLDFVPEDPRVAMPLSLKTPYGSTSPGFEDCIRRLYKKNGCGKS